MFLCMLRRRLLGVFSASFGHIFEDEAANVHVAAVFVNHAVPP
jgi:hypothetical protein